MLMATVHLKDGSNVQVSLEELEDYLNNNADEIEIRHVHRRGLRRRESTEISQASSV